jgi:preprotein translocase subunit YajC
MNLSGLNVLLAMGQPPTPAGTQADPRTALFGPLGFMLLMGVVMYFVMIRPQQKKQKEHAQLLKSVKAGDKVVTSSGILGVVVTVREKTATIRSADAKFEITKSAIAEITERSGEVSQS